MVVEVVVVVGVVEVVVVVVVVVAAASAASAAASSASLFDKADLEAEGVTNTTTATTRSYPPLYYLSGCRAAFCTVCTDWGYSIRLKKVDSRSILSSTVRTEERRIDLKIVNTYVYVYNFLWFLDWFLGCPQTIDNIVKNRSENHKYVYMYNFIRLLEIDS